MHGRSKIVCTETFSGKTTLSSALLRSASDVSIFFPVLRNDDTYLIDADLSFHILQTFLKDGDEGSRWH